MLTNTESRQSGPSQAALDRATRLAASLFEDAVASAIVARGGQTWRSICRPAQAAPCDNAPSAHDVGREARSDDGRPAAGFFAAEPIRLRDGTNVGVLWIAGPTARDHDARRTARLRDLASLIADECDRPPPGQAGAAAPGAEPAEHALLGAMEAAESANRAKTAFLATMSHEIRTPLNGVLGMAQAMAAGALSDIQRSRLNIVRQSGEALLGILNDVLDLSKIEAGKLMLNEAPFDIGQLAHAAHAGFSAVAADKGLGFSLSIEPAAAGVYLGDATRVRQLLNNLVSNALKFTEQGEVRVAIAASETGLTLKISDTGIGVAPDRLGQLFEKFEQADASTTRKFGGTGLGLAICRELTQAMGGTISAESALGRGASFAVDLPLSRVGAPVPAAPEALRAGLPARAAANGLPLHVLAAEDNEVNWQVLKALLQQGGVEPVVVVDGQQVIEAWEASEWDVILMDIQMPTMDGVAATREIRRRELESGRARTPIVAVTANAMRHQAVDYRYAGMDGVVSKPIQVSDLFAAIEEALVVEAHRAAAG